MGRQSSADLETLGVLLQGKFYLSTARTPCAEFNRIDTRARYEGAYFLSLKERKSPQDDHLPAYAFGRCLINFKIYFTCIDIFNTHLS